MANVVQKLRITTDQIQGMADFYINGGQEEELACALQGSVHGTTAYVNGFHIYHHTVSGANGVDITDESVRDMRHRIGDDPANQWIGECHNHTWRHKDALSSADRRRIETIRQHRSFPSAHMLFRVVRDSVTASAFDDLGQQIPIEVENRRGELYTMFTGKEGEKSVDPAYRNFRDDGSLPRLGRRNKQQGPSFSMAA